MAALSSLGAKCHIIGLPWRREAASRHASHLQQEDSSKKADRQRDGGKP
jgi:hypothetical protein